MTLLLWYHLSQRENTQEQNKCSCESQSLSVKDKSTTQETLDQCAVEQKVTETRGHVIFHRGVTWLEEIWLALHEKSYFLRLVDLIQHVYLSSAFQFQTARTCCVSITLHHSWHSTSTQKMTMTDSSTQANLWPSFTKNDHDTAYGRNTSILKKHLLHHSMNPLP